MIEYKLSNEIRNRALIYLEQFIETGADTQEKANQNIRLAKNILSDSNIPTELVKSNNVLSLVTKVAPLVYNSHLDVVRGDPELFKMKKKGGIFLARGASDALGCAVAMIIATQELKKKGIDICLMLVSDEEIGGINGTGYLLNNHLRNKLDQIEFALIGEPTADFNFTVELKGIVRLKISPKGKRKHTAEFTKGNNPIINSAKIIIEIDENNPFKDKIARSFDTCVDFHPTVIHSGIASNIIPDIATIEYDIRHPVEIESKAILDYIRDICNKYNATLEIIKTRSPSRSNTQNPYFKILDTIANNPLRKSDKGSSDSSYFYTNKIDCVDYGPTGGGWHASDEWMDIESFYIYIENLIKFGIEVNNRI